MEPTCSNLGTASRVDNANIIQNWSPQNGVIVLDQKKTTLHIQKQHNENIMHNANATQHQSHPTQSTQPLNHRTIETRKKIEL